jgi:hypothetical protein
MESIRQHLHRLSLSERRFTRKRMTTKDETRTCARPRNVFANEAKVAGRQAVGGRVDSTDKGKVCAHTCIQLPLVRNRKLSEQTEWDAAGLVRITVLVKMNPTCLL